MSENNRHSARCNNFPNQKQEHHCLSFLAQSFHHSSRTRSQVIFGRGLWGSLGWALPRWRWLKLRHLRWPKVASSSPSSATISKSINTSSTTLFYKCNTQYSPVKPANSLLCLGYLVGFSCGCLLLAVNSRFFAASPLAKDHRTTSKLEISRAGFRLSMPTSVILVVKLWL